jgi:hypothetical protein
MGVDDLLKIRSVACVIVAMSAVRTGYVRFGKDELRKVEGRARMDYIAPSALNSTTLP